MQQALPIILQLKRLGKKKIVSLPYVLPAADINCLSDLLRTCVRAETERYNARQRGHDVLPYLLPARIDEQLVRGRVTFGDPAKPRLADVEKSTEDALLAFADGLFAVFVDDVELTSLEQPLALTGESTVTFIRLTFLAGSPW